tara:strand:- start:1535 stop:1789 length:255 start_codon:yes stop_codon:yes gene_type:complete
MNNLHPIGNQLIHALIAKFEADRQEALAIMQLYLNAAVGVGDHPTIVTDLAAATAKLTEAEECLETLQRNFLRTPSDGDEVDDE